MTLRTLLGQLSSLVISLFLAIFVWVVATNEENPTRQALFPDPIPIQFLNRADGTILSSKSADSVRLTVRAPEARWQNLRSDNFKAVADLTGLPTGAERVPVNVTSIDPQVTVVEMDPPAVTVQLEPLKEITLDVRVRVLDVPPVGYEVKGVSADPARVTITGPQSQVDQIADATADVALVGSKTSIVRPVAVTLHDAQGNVIPTTNLPMIPPTVQAHVDVVQRVGYKEVAVKAVLKGNVTSGYWVSDIKVDPATVTLVGTPQALDKIPGFVETQSVAVTGAEQDVTKEVELSLPSGVSALTNGGVTVRVSVEPVLGGITIRRSVNVNEAGCDLPSVVSPDTVEVILSGPLPILQSLTPDDVEIVVDATACSPTSFQSTPRAINVPNSIRVESIVPNTVEVILRAH